MISDQYATSGTLGDMFGVYCKIAGLRKDGFAKPIYLSHYSSDSGFQEICKALISLIPDVTVEFKPITSSKNQTISRVCEEVKAGTPHLNAKFNGISPLALLNDPPYIRMEPFPEVILPIDLPEIAVDRFHVGIQLHSGKLGSNHKGFSLRWLKAVLGKINADDIFVHLFGTGDGYQVAAIEALCRHCDIENHVGKVSFYEWLGWIKSMDFFITPEGFPAFFTMSQHIRTIAFYRNYTIISRVHPLWRKNSFCMSTGEEGILHRVINRVCKKVQGRRMLIAPLSVRQAVSLFHSEFFARTPDSANWPSSDISDDYMIIRK